MLHHMVVGGLLSSITSQVDGEQSLDDIRAILEVDSDIPMAEQVLVNQNNVVTGCVWCRCATINQHRA